MQLITTNTALRNNLSRLIGKYPNIALAVAWATSGTDVFNQLSAAKKKIKQAVIGTHFYQTHPDVLDTFVNSNIVKFMVQPSGVFHPKIYVFWDAGSFEILIGSANLTAGALNKNAEASALITSNDNPALKDEVLALIDGYSQTAKTVNKDDAAAYRRIWDLKKPELDKLAGNYGGKLSSKPPIESPVMSMSWSQFLTAIKPDVHHNFLQRLDLLTKVSEQFKAIDHFNEMPLEVRKTVAGLDSDFHEYSKWFGSMMGVGYFKQAINKNNEHLSRALDEIPLEGAVTKAEFDAYIKHYLKAFPNGRSGLGTASRLLALKRPDTFVCVDAQNLRRLTKDFGMVKAGLDYERYWEEIIMRIQDSPWWKSPEPKNALEKQAWHGRAAMLDAIFYDE